MPIQTEMLPVLAVCREAEEMQRLVDEGNRALLREEERRQWELVGENWGRGLVTIQQLNELHYPNWAWGDFVI